MSSAAEWRRYQNAQWFSFDFDGKVSVMLSLPNGIALVAGSANVTPQDFDGFDRLIDSPMWSQGRANLKTLQKPCDLPDNESIAVSERNVDRQANANDVMPKFYGSIKRQSMLNGIRITYSIEIERSKHHDDGERYQSLYGSWEYIEHLENFPENFDLQSWRIFRDGKLLRQIPSGAFVSLGRVLSDL